MRCASSQSAPFLLSPLHLRHHNGSFSLPALRRSLLVRTMRTSTLPPSRLPSRTSAVGVDHALVAVVAPAKAGDMSVFLQTSVGLLFVYWIANFVVPDLISKHLGFDKLDEVEKTEQRQDGSSSVEAEEGVGSEADSRTNTKRGFNSTRP